MRRNSFFYAVLLAAFGLSVYLMPAGLRGRRRPVPAAEASAAV